MIFGDLSQYFYETVVEFVSFKKTKVIQTRVWVVRGRLGALCLCLSNSVGIRRSLSVTLNCSQIYKTVDTFPEITL